MSLLWLVLLYTLLSPVADGACPMANWWSSFDRKGYSNCASSSQYINGLWRNDNGRGNDGIHLLEQARCCPRPRPYWNQPTDCVIADWVQSLDRKNQWSQCPGGYFLHGLYRSNDKWLHNIEYGKCCKPANHPHWSGHCYTQNVWSSFDKKGLSKCNDGYFMTGLYRGSCDRLYCLEEFRCCKMVTTPPVMKSLSDVKTRVMDETMSELALLAHYLGYGWCSSCRAQWVGEDFRRNGDSWEADKKGPCNGHKSGHRLKMHYRDFKFGIKSIRYGNPVIQDLRPEQYLSGKVRNYDQHAVTHTVERQVSSTRTVTHTKTASWTKSHELGIEINYTPPDATGGVGGSISYKFGYESTKTTQDSTSKQQTNTIKITSQKKLGPRTAAEYRIMMTKTRTTMPYTATIIAQFSAELDGFLRWGGGYNGGSTNYHYQHRGSGSRPTVKYRFGSGSEPFYRALKEQSDRNVRPWQWHDMKAKYSYAQTLINSLKNERKYEFTLAGQFEDVIGQHADIQWKTVPLNGKRAVGPGSEYPEVKRESPRRVFPKPPTVDIKTHMNETIPDVAVNGN